jgi:gluconate 2-dehydrogenase gamma chain
MERPAERPRNEASPNEAPEGTRRRAAGAERLTRRSVLQLLGAAPVAAGFTWTEAEAAGAATSAQAAAAKGAYTPKFFTPHEWATVNLLVNLIIPKDDRSGSATDAGVPEFMDFMMTDQENRQTAMRGGLRWLDLECQDRFDKTFVDCAPAERSAVLDDIAWPAKATPELSHGVAFFNSFRDLTASGFWSSKMGVEDLKYMGNVMAPDWHGCPPEALKKLDVS